MEDVTDFPEQKIIPLMESRPYEEGRYRPASMPTYAGIYPTHIYLHRGKKYDWCSCGHSQIGPFCDG
jgi:CDGSH-type Zn-finger protein